MRKYYPSIQILRGVLFLFILAFHCNAPLAEFGWGGVEAFFVISSFFLIRKHWGNDSLNVAEQTIHRIKRLYPPFIVVLFVAALYALFVNKIPYDIVAHLSSTQSFLWMITGYKSPMQPMTAHSWTLSIEVWLGLIMVILLKVLKIEWFRTAMYAMLGIGVAYRIIAIVCGLNALVISLCPIAHIDAFACGALLAIGMREKKVCSKVSLLSVVGIIGIILCIFLMSNRNEIRLIEGYKLLSSSGNYLNNWFTGNIYLFISLLTVGIVGWLFLHDEKTANRNKSPKFLVALGNKTYTLYLFHWPILVVIQYFIKNWIVLYIVTLSVSVVSTIVFDKLLSLIMRKLGGKDNGSII